MVVSWLAIRAVIFDLMGTLAYRKRRIGFKRLSELLRNMGYDVYHQELEAAYRYVLFIDYPKLRLESPEVFYRQLMLRLGYQPPSRHIEVIAERFEEAEELAPYPDAEEAVRQVHLRYKTALATTIPRFRFQKPLSRVLRYIDHVVNGAEAGVAKPNPKMFLECLRRLGVSPGEAVMVGDSPDLDVDVPYSLGIKCVLLDRGQGVVCAKVEAAIASLKELPHVLAQLQPS
ncbi:MAG: hypothetical protein DRN99_01425 [Thermoproteota archaeon]|nr:MAG: hypothetical protein DRN99_01425 [Candidatus Korarchaeota archaeon]